MIIIQLDSEQLSNLIQSSVRKVLKETQLQTVASTEQLEQLLTIQQAGEFLKLSVPTLYGLVSRSMIPVSKQGKRLYFSKQELTDWIKTGRKKTLKEIGIEAENHL